MLETTPATWRNLLTMREQEIMLLAARGLGNQEIARKLGLAEGTIRFQVHYVLRKLGLKRRSELADLVPRDAG